MKIKVYWRDTNLQLNIKKTDAGDSAFPWDKDVREIEGMIVGDTIILSKIKAEEEEKVTIPTKPLIAKVEEKKEEE